MRDPGSMASWKVDAIDRHSAHKTPSPTRRDFVYYRFPHDMNWCSMDL